MMPSILTREFRIACAGAGKSTWIVTEASKFALEGEPCLIVTYTEENQIELKKKLVEKFGVLPSSIVVKGWFTFLLEDMIRPYQNCLLERRIRNVRFNDSNPHRRADGKNFYTIPGTAENQNFVRHFTANNGQLAHTFFISKLASRIIKASKKASISRLSKIYGAIFFDEVQDLVGWDYEVLSALSKSNLSAVHAVGDFRQTIYQTAFGTKGPRKNSEKQSKFTQMKFKSVPMTGSHRCCQAICDIANLVYTSGSFDDTVSILDLEKYPPRGRLGVFTVHRENVLEYVSTYKPSILRRNKNTETELCRGLETFNFGKAKGKQFDNVLIIPTDPQKLFLLGNRKKLDAGKTTISKAQLYVALTRARHSVAILMDEESSIDGVDCYKG